MKLIIWEQEWCSDKSTSPETTTHEPTYLIDIEVYGSSDQPIFKQGVSPEVQTLYPFIYHF